MRTHIHMIVTAKVRYIPSVENDLKLWINKVVTDVGMKVLSGPHMCYSDVKDNEG